MFYNSWEGGWVPNNIFERQMIVSTKYEASVVVLNLLTNGEWKQQYANEGWGSNSRVEGV